MAVIINGTSGITNVNGSASTPAETGTDTDTGIYYGTNTVGLATNGTSALFIDASQNVGIGTSSPSQKVQIAGGSIQLDTATAVAFGNINTRMQGASDGSFIWYGSATERMRIDSSGNVGIGTTSPSKQLYVFTASGSLQIQSVVRNSNTGTGVAAIGFNVASTSEGDYTQAGIGLLRGIANGSGSLCFYNKGSGTASDFTTADEKMRIDSSGNLLVGMTTQSATTLGATIQGTGGTIGQITSCLSASTNSTQSYVLYSTGASAYRFYVQMDGKINATNTTIAAISDIRLKENIRDIDVGLDAILALKPRKFDWKDGKGKNIKGDRGWIAQEFEQTFPEMIGTWLDEPPEGEEPYKSVSADLIPVLVKAIQEQQAIITQLQADIATLKGQA